MGLCETLLPFLVNPLTYLVGGGGLIGLGLLYSYSSYTFLPTLFTLSRLTSPFNFSFNIISKALDHGALKIVALYTTFSATIQTLISDGLSTKVLVLAGTELVDKAALSVKNIVQGIDLFTQWIATYEAGTCSLVNNSELLWNAGLSVWTGIAVYIFVIWVWNQSWYTWRNEEMEQQQIVLIILAVSSMSLAVYGFEVLNQGVANTESLVNLVKRLT